MERVNENNAAPIIYNFDPDNVLRCAQCSLICSLKLNYIKDGKSTISYNCEKNHSGNKLLTHEKLNYRIYFVITIKKIQR